MYLCSFASVVLLISANRVRAELDEPVYAPKRLPQAKACIPPAGGTPAKDDTPAIVQTIKQCGEGATITFPARSRYHINSPLIVTGCNGCTVQIDGTIKASGSSKAWEKSRCIFGFKNSSGLKIN